MISFPRRVYFLQFCQDWRLEIESEDQLSLKQAQIYRNNSIFVVLSVVVGTVWRDAPNMVV